MTPLFHTLYEFFTSIISRLHWNSRDCESLQVFRTLLNILADLNSAAGWMISILPLISISLSLFFRNFGDRSMRTRYNWYNRHLHIPQIFRVYHTSLSWWFLTGISRTLLSISADLNNAVVWIVSIRPLIFWFPSPCTNPLITVPSAPITTGITVTFIVFFFSSLAMSRYLSLFSLPFNFTLWSAETAKSTI